MRAKIEALRAEADRLGYPARDQIDARRTRARGVHRAIGWAARAGAAPRADRSADRLRQHARFIVEKLITPAHLIGVQVLADHLGQVVHLGEREGSLMRGNQKMIEEAPAPCLSPAQREQLWQTAVEIARLIGFRGVGTIEFMGDLDGHFYFTEIKPRIQIEHTVTEMISIGRSGARANSAGGRRAVVVHAGRGAVARSRDLVPHHRARSVATLHAQPGHAAARAPAHRPRGARRYVRLFRLCRVPRNMIRSWRR